MVSSGFEMVRGRYKDSTIRERQRERRNGEKDSANKDIPASSCVKA